MLNGLSACLRGLLIATVVLAAAPAEAQFVPRTLNDPATGEEYHIEGFAGLWSPSHEMSIQSESLGIAGSAIDFKQDLGLEDQRFGDVRLVGRPARKHKFRFQYTPIEYNRQSFSLVRNLTFNGQLYRVGLPVESHFLWKAYRLGYEYDFIVKNRGFGGLILDVKYTDVAARLRSTVIEESIRARAPIPSLGGIVRVYVVPNISITGEVTGIKIPDSISKEYKAHYADVDIYGTLNFTRNVGVQGGYRTLDVGYRIDKDTGSFVLRGIYFGVVARY